MKMFLRTLASVLLFSMLSLFCLWRHDVMPDMTNVTLVIRQAAGAAGDAIAAIQNGEDVAGVKASAAARPVDTGGNYASYDLSEPLDPALETAICTGLANMDAEIDIGSFHLTREATDAAINQIRFSHPEFFYVGLEYQIGTIAGNPNKYVPHYLYTAGTVATMRETYQQKLDEITSGVPAGATDFDKVLYLHDYFIRNYTYDHTLTIRDAYTFFTEKTGVCQAYMLAFIAAAGELGVTSVPVTSEVMNHAWNLVRVDGQWYHMDVTWDDCMTIDTFVSYNYFLQSGNGLSGIDAGKEDGHRDWTTSQNATSTKYDGVIWRSTMSPLVKTGGKYYAALPVEADNRVARGVVYAGTDVTAMEALFDITGGYWMAGTTGYYPGCYSGLVVSGNRLYYNSGNTIYARDLTTGLPVYTVAPNLGAAGRSIYGLDGIVDGKIRFAAATSPNDADFVRLECTA